MKVEVKAVKIVCDCCGKTYYDSDDFCCYVGDKDYCPICHYLNDEDHYVCKDGRVYDYETEELLKEGEES